MAWYLVLLSLAATLLLLNRFTLTWLTFIAGGSCRGCWKLFVPTGSAGLARRTCPALPPSPSSPDGDRLGCCGGCHRSVLFPRVHGLRKFSALQNRVQHPYIALKFFLFAVGDVVGLGATGIHQGNGAVTLFGLVIVMIAVVTIVTCGIRRDPKGGGPIGIALILFGLLFAAVITEGRIYGGYVSASASRYTTFDLLIPVGIYLAVLGQPAITGNGLDPNTGAVDAERVDGNQPFDRVFAGGQSHVFAGLSPLSW